MKCPQCGNESDKVVDSRAVREGRAVRRRRECLDCGERYTTYESAETRPVLVVKRSGERVAYHRSKVIVGVTKACEKRPVTFEQIEMVVDRVEQKLAGSGRREVPSEAIGLLDEAKQKRDTVLRLGGEIREALASKQTMELLPMLEHLMALQPFHKHARE